MQSTPQIIIKTECESDNDNDDADASDEAEYSLSELSDAENETDQKPKSILKKRKANLKSSTLKDSDLVPTVKRKSKKTERWELLARIKPDPINERESERKYIAVATKGVVQLFNAVKQHQTSIGKSLSTTKGVRNAEKVLAKSTRKQNFVNKLAHNSRNLIVKEENNDKNETKKLKKPRKQEHEDSKWGVFKDDFLTTE